MKTYIGKVLYYATGEGITSIWYVTKATNIKEFNKLFMAKINPFYHKGIEVFEEGTAEFSRQPTKYLEKVKDLDDMYGYYFEETYMNGS